MPVRKTLFTDYSTPERAALRRRNENLMAEAKSQDLPVPPTPDEATLQAELDETDKRLEQLERELNKLIKSESEDDAERLRADLKECRNKKLELERELGKCRRLHSETDRRLQRLEEAFFNFVQSDSVDDAERLSADLRECTQKRNELEQQLRQCRNPGGMDFLSPEESAEFERDRRQAFQQADFKPVSELDLSNAPEPVYDDELLKKYENSEKQLKFCKNQLELCKLQEAGLVAENKQLMSNVEQQGIQINFYLKALETNREEQAQRKVAETSDKGELTNQIALLELTNATQNAKLAKMAQELSDAKAELGEQAEVIKKLNDSLNITKSAFDNARFEQSGNTDNLNSKIESKNAELARCADELEKTKRDCDTAKSELISMVEEEKAQVERYEEELRRIEIEEDKQLERCRETNAELTQKNNEFISDIRTCEKEKNNLKLDNQLYKSRTKTSYIENSELRERNIQLEQDLGDKKEKLKACNEGFNKLSKQNEQLKQRVRQLLPTAQAQSVDIPMESLWQQDTPRAEQDVAKIVKAYIKARVKWWVLDASEKTGRINDVQRILQTLDDVTVTDLFPLDENVLLRYRVKVLSLLKNKWKEVTNEEWVEEDTGFFSSVTSLIYNPDPIPTIRKILKEFENIGIDGLIREIEIEKKGGSTQIQRGEDGGGESKNSGEREQLRSIDASELFATQQPGRPAPVEQPSAPSYGVFPPPVAQTSAPDLSDNEGGVEFVGGETNDVDQRSRDAFAQGGGGIDLSAIDERTSRRKTRPRRGRFPTNFENMSETELRDKLRKFEPNERYGYLLNNEPDMRDALRRLFKEGKVNKKGEKKVLQPVALQTVLRF